MERFGDLPSARLPAVGTRSAVAVSPGRAVVAPGPLGVGIREETACGDWSQAFEFPHCF